MKIVVQKIQKMSLGLSKGFEGWDLLRGLLYRQMVEITCSWHKAVILSD